MKRINITIPIEEHKAALSLLPYGQVRTFSALIRLALQQLPKKKK